MPRFFLYHSLVSFGLSEKKKIPPMPVTLGVVSFVAGAVFAVSFFCSSMGSAFFVVELQPARIAAAEMLKISRFIFYSCFCYSTSNIYFLIGSAAVATESGSEK